MRISVLHGSHGSDWRPGVNAGASGRRGLGQAGRQRDDEPGAPVRRELDVDMSSVQLHDLATDVQAQADSRRRPDQLFLAVCLVEAVEDAVLSILRDARPTIAY